MKEYDVLNEKFEATKKKLIDDRSKFDEEI